MNTADTVLTNALTIYCKWRTNLADDGIVYIPDDFLVYDPERKLYGTSELILYVPCHNFYIFRVYDGDDGGSAYIHVWTDGSENVVHMVHEFDTMFCNVCSTEYKNRRDELVIHYFNPTSDDTT